MIIENPEHIALTIPDLNFADTVARSNGVITFAAPNGRSRIGRFRATIDGEPVLLAVKPITGFKSTNAWLEARQVD